MSRKRILLLVDWFRPGFRAGGPIQSCANLVDWLGDEFEFSIVTTNTDWGSTQPYEGIVPNQWIEHGNHRVFYASGVWLSFDNLSKLLTADNYDFVVLNSMYSKVFTQWPLKIFANQISAGQLLLAPRGMLRPGALAIKPLKKKLFLKWFQWKGWHRAVTFLSTGEHETEDVKRVFGAGVKIKNAPNLPGRGSKEWNALPKEKGKAEFISIGRITAVKNPLFTLRIFKQVVDGARLQIYGPKGEAAYVSEFVAELEKMKESGSVTFGGELTPDQVSEELSKAHFFILPSVSENFGHAIFEALSLGKPVIISDQTPWRGLVEKQMGWDLSLNEESVFVNAVKQARDMTNEEYERWSRNAWVFAQQYVNASGVLDANRNLFQ